MVLFANGPRLHRDAMAAALSARGREAGVPIPEGWSVAEAVNELHPAVVVYSGSHEDARALSLDVAVAHLDGERTSLLTTYVAGAVDEQQRVGSFDAIAEQLENLAGVGTEPRGDRAVRL
ncbi:MAG TPA: hypothetical protein VG602_10295 [Actinomycetota bacterium]|nr:hypothetical protein [Actinomycetota bacterium]